MEKKPVWGICFLVFPYGQEMGQKQKCHKKRRLCSAGLQTTLAVC